jgi:hypothetical protein
LVNVANSTVKNIFENGMIPNSLKKRPTTVWNIYFGIPKANLEIDIRHVEKSTSFCVRITNIHLRYYLLMKKYWTVNVIWNKSWRCCWLSEHLVYTHVTSQLVEICFIWPVVLVFRIITWQIGNVFFKFNNNTIHSPLPFLFIHGVILTSRYGEQIIRCHAFVDGIQIITRSVRYHAYLWH